MSDRLFLILSGSVAIVAGASVAYLAAWVSASVWP